MRAGDADDVDQGATPTLEMMLEAIPLGVEISVDLNALADLPDPEDPAMTPSGRRFCIAERRAGGRCTAPPLLDGLLCSPHSGLLDARTGGLARAQQRRDQGVDAEERVRLGRLGARGVIAATANDNPLLLRKAFLTLLEDAAQGDRTAAKLVGPWLNQGLGMPTETTMVVQPESASDLASMSTSDLQQWVEAKRQARLAAAREPVGPLAQEQ